MSKWSHGYDVSMGYSFGFFREMAPDWLDFCAMLAGFEAPERRTGKFRYLELGSGQGFGLCLLAAANPEGEFIGVDFQPEHVTHSRSLADSAGLTNVRFIEADFMDLAAQWPRQLGEFEYVTLHGIYSWVSDELRTAVLQCLDHSVAPGGLVYASYNALPGWLGSVPFQHFAVLMKGLSSEPGTVVVDRTLDLLSSLAAAKAPVFQALPTLAPKVEAMKGREKSYLVHEFLAEGWKPFWQSQVREQFRRSQLDYVASATLADDLVAEFLPSALHDTLAQQQDEKLREDLQDFIINKAFRRDIYCRGARKRSGGKNSPEAVLYKIAAVPPATPISFETAFGVIKWDPEVFRKIVDAAGAGPKPIDALFRLPPSTAWQPRHVLLLLLHASVLGVGAARAVRVEVAQRLNTVVAQAVSNGAPYRQLAAANLGSGITVSVAEMLLLNAWLECGGTTDQPTLTSALARRLHRNGEGAGDRLGNHGGEQPDQMVARFSTEILPRWRQLGVVA